jgi:transglutaminase-like putative cysteine protease
MILEIQHETCQEYSEPVSEWHTVLRMQPKNDEHQSCHSFQMTISQQTPVFCFQDGFGNQVHHFSLLEPRQQIRVLSACVVETLARECDLTTCDAVFPLDLEPAGCDVLDFLPFRGPICDSPLLPAILDELQPAQGERVSAWVERVNRFIPQRFEYARDVTDWASPIHDLLSLGKGVCQDFAHLMIGVLRRNGVPARYVSGYIHRPNKESQSHAWCEAWFPGLGWVGFDPTNACQVNERFVRVAIGRDYTDVPPNKGVHRGQAQESISVRVETRELPRLPSLSWQEQLPPLHVPLTSLVRRRARAAALDENSQQQQQQQQQRLCPTSLVEAVS